MANSDFDFEGNDEALRDHFEGNSEDFDEEATDDFDDDDFLMDDDLVGDDDEEGGGEEEDLEEDVDDVDEKEEVEEEPEAEDEGGDPYKKVRDDIISTLQDGEDTMFTVKGKQYRAGDIPSAEWVNIIQKGIRGDQIFQETAQLRRELERERELVNRGTEQVQRLLEEYGQGGKQKPGKDARVPDFLKPNDLDSDQEKLLKQYAADVTQRVAALEASTQDSEIKQYENQVLTEVKELAKEYPVASVDEVLAVKAQYPKERLEDLMRMSNQYYSSLDFLRKALEANPTAARELEETFVRKYNAKKSKARNVGVKRSRTSGSKKVSTQQAMKPGKDFTFDNAEDIARDYLAEVRRLRKA